MLRTAYLSGVAIAVLAMAAGPASAQLLNLGGGDGPLISIGSGGDGGSSGGAEANIDVNLGGALGGNGSSDGVNVDLSGGSGVDSSVRADLFGGGSSDGDGADVRADLGIGDGGVDGDVVLDLFGSSGGTVGAAELGLGEDGDADAVVRLGGIGAGDDLTQELVGDGLRNIGDLRGIAGDRAIIELFGGSDDTLTTGSVAAAPDGGTAGGGAIQSGGSSGSAAGSLPGRLDSRLVANARDDAAVQTDCFSPDAAQIDHLLARNSYDAAVAASWGSAAKVSIVPVEICPDARTRLAAAIEADSNIGFMQTRVASTAAIRAAIAPEFGPDDVLAIDKRDDQLIVYVY